MPIHDWTTVEAGTFHYFHQDWSIEICRTLNQGLLPPGYTALPEQIAERKEPDVLAIQTKETSRKGGLAVAEIPPRARQIARIESDLAIYARKANLITIRQDRRRVVAIVEILSPGNKDGDDAIEAFKSKVIHFLQHGISVVLIDLFPPTNRDPEGIHQYIWKFLTNGVSEPRPFDKPLSVVSYDADGDLVAYVDSVAVGDSLPDAPLFLAPGWYVNIPLEETYERSWKFAPESVRELFGES